MLKRFLPATLNLFGLGFASVSIASQPKYDLPGNSHLPNDKFIPEYQIYLGLDPRYIRGSARLIPWSDYAGVKSDATKTIAPDRMVWEVLTFYCNQAPPERIRYYYSAFDAVTRKQLTAKRTQVTYDVYSLPPIKAYGSQWSYPRCR